MRTRQNPGHLPSVTEIAEQGYGEFEDYFPASAAGEMDTDQGDAYHGRNVIWLGDEGRMFRVDPDYLTHIWGNIFDEDKLAAVVNGIEQAEERVTFFAPYGQVTKVGLDEVRESIQYADDEGLDRPLSTGDEELDQYLIDPEEVLEEYADPDDEPKEFASKKAEFDRQLREAVDSDEGDLGSWTATIRDGNHRAFGALVAGEPYIWMILYDNDYQDLVQSIKAGTPTDEQLELWELLQ